MIYIFNNILLKFLLKTGIKGYPIKKYKQSEFGKYDKFLLKRHLVTKFNNYDCVSKVKDLSIAKFDKEYLKKYIINANKEIDNPRLYKINSCLFYKVLNKRELDDMLNNCCKYIIEFISSIN